MPVAQHFRHILSRIDQCIARSGRTSCPVRLVAVSKKQSREKIDEALSFGHRVFGENYVQEALAHWQDRRALYPDLELHLIGPLQSNKVKQAVPFFDVIESVDRIALVDEISRVGEKLQKFPKLFVQVNIGREPQKSGVLPEGLPDLIHYIRSKNLPLIGLMAIPPDGVDPDPYFKELASLARYHDLSELSMGMSSDFETAIEHGATLVRIGTGLFGER